ncbi:MAG: DUF3089 domain-containing protein [Amphiplicatus sp.]
MTLRAILALCALAAAGCSRGGENALQAALLKPGHAFDATKAPPAPDYASPDAWAALPERNDAADQAPEGAANRQSEARADVFFIHPTTYFKKDGWNAPYTEGGDGAMSVDGGTMRAQASAFNGCCRVFAPRYRQATLWTFMDFTANSEAALDFAYQDIARAFADFIESRNDGRPFIVAAHSQGSYHAMRLLEEKIIGTPLAERLVAAYAIGGPVPEAFVREALPACETAAQTGCLIGWNTVSAAAQPDPRRDRQAIIWLNGRYQPIAGRKLLCVNPLDWSVGGTAPASLNLGALPGKQVPGALSAPLPGHAGASCRGGYLIVDFPEGSNAFVSRLTKKGSYHVFDYNLFYMNIRANAEARAEALLAR